MWHLLKKKRKKKQDYIRQFVQEQRININVSWTTLNFKSNGLTIIFKDQPKHFLR